MQHSISKISPCLTLILWLAISANTLAQHDSTSMLDPKFTTFQGPVFHMQQTKTKRGGRTIYRLQEYYSEIIYDYQQIGEVKLNKINIPETETSTGKFPGVDRTVKFAMILHGEMEILVPGCYEFSLTSDDGSRLWINDQQIVNNDGGHGMKNKVDSMSFDVGNYKAKLWYFQGMPDRFGFIMEAKYIGDKSLCTQEFVIEDEHKVITLQDVLFDTNEHQLNANGLKEIQALASQLKMYKITNMQIIGHTDNIGKEDYNQKLSMNRALSIKNHLQTLLTGQDVTIEAIGKGSSSPIASNSTDHGRKQNRRVELIIK